MHSGYPWPDEYASSRSTDGGRTWSQLQPTEGHNAVPLGNLTLAQQHRAWLVEPGLLSLVWWNQATMGPPGESAPMCCSAIHEIYR